MREGLQLVPRSWQLEGAGAIPFLPCTGWDLGHQTPGVWQARPNTWGGSWTGRALEHVPVGNRGWERPGCGWGPEKLQEEGCQRRGCHSQTWDVMLTGGDAPGR